MPRGASRTVVFAVLFSADCQDILAVCFRSLSAAVPGLTPSATNNHSRKTIYLFIKKILFAKNKRDHTILSAKNVIAIDYLSWIDMTDPALLLYHSKTTSEQYGPCSGMKSRSVWLDFIPIKNLPQLSTPISFQHAYYGGKFCYTNATN